MIPTYVRGLLALAIAFVSTSALTATAQTTHYSVTDLGTLGGGYSTAWDVSNQGWIVGESPVSGWAVPNAFLWRDGQMFDLNNLIYPPQSWFVYHAHGIADNNGLIVGTGEHRTLGGPRAYIVNSSAGFSITDIGTLGGANSSANAVNDRGEVVGQSHLPNNIDNHAFYWVNGLIVDLGTMGGRESAATDINSFGAVVGWSRIANNTNDIRAFIVGNARLLPLGTLGGRNSYASAINDAMQIVGKSDISPTASSPTHAFLHNGERMIDLGTLGGSHSSAADINEDGIIVGESGTVDHEAHAFVWQDGVMTDLNDLIFPATIWELREATAVNDNGEIVGWGYHNNETRAFLLTPETGGILRINTLTPGVAGQVNTLRIVGATPGAAIDVVYGFAAGLTPVPGCLGISFGIDQPRYAGQAIANANGVAELTRRIPRAAQGKMIYIQAVDRAQCQVSARVTHLFPAP